MQQLINIITLSTIAPLFVILLQDNIFSVYYNLKTEKVVNVPVPPTFHCPEKIQYIPVNSMNGYINASHNDHPLHSVYLWNIIDHDMDEESKINIMKSKTYGRIMEIIDFSHPGFIDFKLDISYTHTIGKWFGSQQTYSTQCNIKLIIHSTPILGIDLGTTYSCIAYQRNLKKENMRRDTHIVVTNKRTTEYCVPSMIYFQSNGQVIVGEEAKNKLNIDPYNVIYDIKRIIGRNSNDIEIKQFKEKHPFINITHDNKSIFIPNLNQTVLYEQSLSVLLGYLVEIASIEWNIPYIRDVVVSIPALFHNGQRKGIRSACHLAGLNAKKLVIEPTVASVAYSYYQSKPDRRLRSFLAFDFGGGTLDCSIMKCSGLECQVLSVTGNSSLGGIDFDNVIADIIISKLNETRAHISPDLYSNILTEAEKVKKDLSDSSECSLKLRNDAGVAQSIIITKKEFENHPITQELIKYTLNLVDNAINNYHKLINIKMILMIGGTSKIPIIQNALKNKYGDILVYPDIDSELMVVYGAGIIAGSLAYTKYDDTADEIVFDDIIPLPLGVEQCIFIQDDGVIECGIMKILIDKNTYYPTNINTSFCQVPHDANTLDLEIYEGENYYVGDNFLLANIVIRDIPIRDKNEECDNIILEFIIDGNGIAQIEAKTNIKYGKVQKYNTSINIDSKLNGTLSYENVTNYKRNMIKWYNKEKHQLIRNAFNKDCTQNNQEINYKKSNEYECAPHDHDSYPCLRVIGSIFGFEFVIWLFCFCVTSVSSDIKKMISRKKIYDNDNKLRDNNHDNADINIDTPNITNSNESMEGESDPEDSGDEEFESDSGDE